MRNAAISRHASFQSAMIVLILWAGDAFGLLGAVIPMALTSLICHVAYFAIKDRERAAFEMSRYPIVIWYSTCSILFFFCLVLLVWCAWMSARIVGS